MYRKDININISSNPFDDDHKKLVGINSYENNILITGNICNTLVLLAKDSLESFGNTLRQYMKNLSINVKDQSIYTRDDMPNGYISHSNTKCYMSLDFTDLIKKQK